MHRTAISRPVIPSPAQPAAPVTWWTPSSSAHRGAIFIGPGFRNIANTPGITATALRVFLTTSHPNVPNPIVTSEQMADVIAYILSLRSEP